LPGVRSQGHSEGPKSFHRALSHGGRSAPEVHHRSPRSRDAASGQRIFAARLEGRDPAAEKQSARHRVVVDRLDALAAAYVNEHLARTRRGKEVDSVLQREFVSRWGQRSIHDLQKREIMELVMLAMARGTPVAANKLLKIIKAFLSWCVGRAILEVSPAQGLKAPYKEKARDRVLSDMELAAVIRAARRIGFPYGDIVELLALTGQRRQEIVALTRDEIDFDARVLRFQGFRTKNGKPHTVHISCPALAILERLPMTNSFLLSSNAAASFQNFSAYKRELDALSGVIGWRLHDLRRTCVSGMARLGVAPHIADKILNHQTGTISGVAAVYQRYEFMEERTYALERWGEHVAKLVTDSPADLIQVSQGHSAYGSAHSRRQIARDIRSYGTSALDL